MGYGPKYYRHREANETPKASEAIRLHCSECMGHQPGDVEGCTNPGCWLYPWRKGTPEARRQKRAPLTPEQAKARGEALERARIAKKAGGG